MSARRNECIVDLGQLLRPNLDMDAIFATITVPSRYHRFVRQRRDVSYRRRVALDTIYCRKQCDVLIDAHFAEDRSRRSLIEGPIELHRWINNLNA